jgi:DNA polymerase-1
MDLGLDFETTGLDYWQPDFRVLNFAVATIDGSWSFDVRSAPGAARWLADTLTNRCEGARVAAHNAQFEYQCSRVLGIDPRKVDWWCTMIHACLIDEHQLTYNLASVAGYFGVESRKVDCLDRLQALLGAATPAAAVARLSELPPGTPALVDYVTSDAVDALRIMMAQRVEVHKQGLQVVSRLEMDLLPVLADMSWHGIRVDLEAAHAAIPKLDEKEAVLAQDIKNIVGCKDAAVFVNSPKQMREFFKPEPLSKFQWRLIDGTIVGPTKGGTGPSLAQDAMREIQHPLAEKVLAYRKTLKLRDTFIRGHVIGSADGDGYVHTQFNQTRNDGDAGTITGRLSSTDPALQQITKRDKENAAILRAMFLADDGEDWMCADYNQVDFRCGAHLQNDPKVIAMYADNPKLDYHQVVSDMTGIPRNPPYAGAPNTKQINLGLSFGAGQGKLAFMMKMPYAVKESRGRMAYVAGPEATAIFDLYHVKLPAVKTFMKKAENVAKETHYVRTATGRRLRFPRGLGAHKAAGLLYQAYAADIHKYGLIKVDRVIRDEKLPARLMMSCHDEIGVSMKQDPQVRDLIVREYTDFSRDESPIKMRVPILASGDFGSNWYEASK